MATSTTETSERDDTERSTTADAQAGDAATPGLPSRAIEQVKNGRLPMLVGGVMAARGVRGLLSKRGRGLAQTTAGLVLLGLGLRQRSKRKSGGGPEFTAADSVPGTETVARRADSNEPGSNPRDVDDEPDVATAGDPGEGDVQFETDRDDADMERKPHLDETDPKDPRYPDEGDPETDDNHVDVDISESALADEPNEAVGPDEEQAYPASEGTDPEPSAAQSPEQSEGEAVDEPDANDEDAETLGDDEPTADADDESEDDEAAGDDDDIEESI